MKLTYQADRTLKLAEAGKPKSDWELQWVWGLSVSFQEIQEYLITDAPLPFHGFVNIVINALKVIPSKGISALGCARKILGTPGDAGGGANPLLNPRLLKLNGDRFSLDKYFCFWYLMMRTIIR